jgi:hypothetical protein
MTTAIVYRGYEIVITLPADPTGPWRALVWRLKQGPPIPMATYASEDAATQAARSAVDQRLAAGRAPD